MSAAIQAPAGAALTPPSAETLAQLKALHEWVKQFEQTPIATEHLLHAGMYARTIRLEPQTILNGSLIKAATILIVHGSCAAVAGDRVVELEGYSVIPGCAGRKQTFVTRSAVEMTMICAIDAKTVEAAEDAIFAEADELMSRQDGANDTCIITGE